MNGLAASIGLAVLATFAAPPILWEVDDPRGKLYVYLVWAAMVLPLICRLLVIAVFE